MSYTPQNFINAESVVQAAWLNGVDEMVYNVLGGWQGQSVPIVLSALGLTGASGITAVPVPIAEGGSGQTTAAGALAAFGGTTLTAAEAAILINPVQTPAELAASVNPTNINYPEGWIQRYGAATNLGDNSAAINAALAVSGHGGSAAFIPGGTWSITSNLTAPAGSSMYGMGKGSVISVANGVDGIQISGVDGQVPTARFFRDFNIVGTLAGTGPYTNNAHGIYVNASSVVINFSNIGISNFLYGMEITGLYDSKINSMFIQNCWNGIYMNQLSVNVEFSECICQLVSPNSTVISGSGYSQGFTITSTGGNEPQGVKVYGGSFYGYQYGASLGLFFNLLLHGIDFDFSTVCPIICSSTIGYLVIRDCWIELASTASGTWNDKVVVGDGNLTGIFIPAQGAQPTSKIKVISNTFWADSVIATSLGLYIGTGNAGIVVKDNYFYNFGIGISGGNSITNTGPAVNGGVIEHNTINANVNSMFIDSLCSELILGPNYIEGGGQAVFTSTPPVSMIYRQPNAPMKGTAAFSTATSVAVAFTNALPSTMNNYRVSLSGNAAGYCWVTSKTNTGFTINCSASNSNSVDWAIQE